MIEPSDIVFITLTPDEIAWAQGRADAILAQKLARGVTARRIELAKHSLDTHVLGLKAECAVARALGLEMPEFSDECWDRGIDLICRGYSLQIKAEPDPFAKLLIFQLLEHFRADYAVFCKLRAPDEIAIMGCINKLDYRMLARGLEHKYNKPYAVETYQLQPLSSLQDLPNRSYNPTTS